jgi:hypothetical protein
MRRLLTAALLLSAAACAPTFRALPQPGLESPLPEGPSQGPFRVHVPLEPRWPHRLRVTLTSRCLPAFRLDVQAGALHDELQLGATGEEGWQQALRTHFLGSTTPVPPPVIARPPSPPPGLTVGVAGGGVVTPGGAAGGATATASVTLPGRWVVQETPDMAFDRERAARCQQVETFSLVREDPLDPGLEAVDVVLWSEVPQLLAEARLQVEVDQLQPPPEPRPELVPPAPGSTWAAGHSDWYHASPYDFGWRWSEGAWLRPATPPPDKDEAPGRPSHDGALWSRGSWRWESRGGWVWTSGRWVVPERPSIPAPAPREEHPGQAPKPGQTWFAGRWEWSADGWAWLAGHWGFGEHPVGAPPPLKLEVPGAPPAAGVVWVSGVWKWSQEAGWVWVAGRWDASATPSSPRPPPKPEPASPQPLPGAVWVSGRWEWTPGPGWVWYSGKWTLAQEAPRPVVVPPPPPVEAFAPMPVTKPPPKPVCTAVMGPPPPARAEAQPASPSPGSVWFPGLWRWDDCAWRWQAGRWNQPPEPGMVWVPGPTLELGRWEMGGVVR